VRILHDPEDLQETMQDLVGIVRTETEMHEAMKKIASFKTRAERLASRQSRIHPGWHTALDLKNLLTASESITRAALERKESRGAQFREDYPDRTSASVRNTIISKAADGSMNPMEPLPEMPDYLKTGDRRESMNVQFKIWRGDANGGAFREIRLRMHRSWVVLDAVSIFRRRRHAIWRADGIARQESAGLVQQK